MVSKKLEYVVSQIQAIKQYAVHDGFFFRGVSQYLNDAGNSLSAGFKIHQIDLVTSLDYILEDGPK